MTALSIDELSLELEALRLSSFDYDWVWQFGGQLRKRAQRAKAPVAIQIRHGEDLVFSTLLPGGTADNFDWTRRKCAVAHRFQKSSLAVKLMAEEKKFDFNAAFRLPPSDFVASGGGFPLMLKSGAMIGTVAVCGLPDIDDHELITSTLREFL